MLVAMPALEVGGREKPPQTLLEREKARRPRVPYPISLLQEQKRGLVASKVGRIQEVPPPEQQERGMIEHMMLVVVAAEHQAQSLRKERLPCVLFRAAQLF